MGRSLMGIFLRFGMIRYFRGWPKGSGRIRRKLSGRVGLLWGIIRIKVNGML